MDVPFHENFPSVRNNLQMKTFNSPASEKFSLDLFCQDDIIYMAAGTFLSLFQLRVLRGRNYTIYNRTLAQYCSIEYQIIAERVIPVPIKIEMDETRPLMIAFSDELMCQI